MKLKSLRKWLPDLIVEVMLVGIDFVSICKSRAILQFAIACLGTAIVEIGYCRCWWGVDLDGLVSSSVEAMGALVGFLIASTSLVAASGSKKMEDLRGKNKGKVLGRERTMYDYLMSEMAWATGWSAISLLVLLIMSGFDMDVDVMVGSVIVVFLNVYCVLMSVTMVAHLYIVFTAVEQPGSKGQNKPPEE